MVFEFIKKMGDTCQGKSKRKEEKFPGGEPWRTSPLLSKQLPV